jgi:uncharacterized protein YbjQ (UPF0145 family)
MPIPIFTIKDFDKEKYEPLGMVTGSDQESVSGIRKWFVDFFSIFGGKSTLLHKKIDDTLEKAKADLLKNTAKEFPTAVAIYNVKMSMEVNNWQSQGQGFLHCVMSGTAVGYNDKNFQEFKKMKEASKKTNKANNNNKSRKTRKNRK